MSINPAAAATRLKYIEMGLVRPAKDVEVDVRICQKCGGKIFIMKGYRDKLCLPCKRPYLNLVKEDNQYHQ